jgi:hypothetical protein
MEIPQLIYIPSILFTQNKVQYQNNEGYVSE